MMIFLMHYDPAQGGIVELTRFNDGERPLADKARLELEMRLNREKIEHEVVLLEASSEAALRRTHRRYFENRHELTT